MGMIAVADIVKVHGRDVDMDAVKRAARCSRCKCKSITNTQIIYVGGSNEAMRTGRQANTGVKFVK